MATYQLRLSGTPQLLKDERVLKIGRRKSLAVLAYLALQETSTESEYLAELLWPDSRKNRASLRTAISYLNSVAQEPLLARDGPDISLNPQIAVSTDVLEITKFVEKFKQLSGQQHEEPQQLDLLERAIRLWRGRFLSGFYLHGCPDFENWMLREENEVDQAVDFAFSILIRRFEQLQNYGKAILYARKSVNYDPSNEKAHRNLIHLYARTGQRQAAIRQYRYCKKTLKEELGLQPDETTEVLYRSVLNQSSGQKIAVLCFNNLSDDPAEESLSDGLSDEIRSRLSQIYSLHVISRASTIKFKGSHKDIPTVAKKLSVRLILDGTLLRSGDDLKVTVELIDAIDEIALWSRTYNGSMHDLFDMEENISRSIIEALNLSTSAEEQQRIIKRPIQNVHAFEAYLRAKPGIWAFDAKSLKAAEQELRNALQIVGSNELLYASLGLVNLQFLNAGVSSDPAYLLQAEEYARKLVDLNPDSSYRYFLRGYIYYIRGEFQEAVRDLKRACLLDPNDPEALLQLSYIYMLVGKTSAARPYLDRLLEVDPLTPIVQCLPGFLLTMEGDLAASPKYYLKFYQMDPDQPASRLFYGWNLALAGRIDESWDILDRITEQTAQRAYFQASAMMKHALRGDKKQALDAVTTELISTAKKVEYLSRFLTDCYALISCNDKAFDWLEQDLHLGFCNYPYLSKYNPFFATLRKEKRFQRLIRKVKLSWEDFEI